MDIIRDLFKDNEAVVRSFDRAQEFQNLLLFGRYNYIFRYKKISDFDQTIVYKIVLDHFEQELQASSSP